MRKKLLLVNVVDTQNYSDKKTVNSNKLLKSWQPVQLGIIAALTPSDWDVEIIDENFEAFEFKEADLVGLSSYTSSINHAYHIAKIYRNSNIPVVIGGIHVSFFPDEALKYVDIVAVGKAEGLWSELMNDFNNNSLKQIYHCKDNAEVCFKPDRNIFKKYNYPAANIMSSLGCLNNCTYCNIPIFQDHRYHLRDIDDIVKEIVEIEQDYIIFNDDDFFGTNDYHRKRIISLFNKIISLKIRKKWMCFTSFNISNYPNILNLAHRAGCTVVFIGIESTDKSELLLYNKYINKKLSEENYQTAIETIHKHKIAIWGSFICGSPLETLDSIILKSAEIRKMKLDNITSLYLTPLPRTPFYLELEKKGKLLYTSFPEDWIYYNFSTLTFFSEYGTASEFHTAYQKLKSTITAPYKGLIRNYRLKKFISTIIYTKSLKTAIYSSVFFHFWEPHAYNSKFFRILFRYFAPQTNG